MGRILDLQWRLSSSLICFRFCLYNKLWILGGKGVEGWQFLFQRSVLILEYILLSGSTYQLCWDLRVIILSTLVIITHICLANWKSTVAFSFLLHSYWHQLQITRTAKAILYMYKIWKWFENRLWWVNNLMRARSLYQILAGCLLE